MKISILGISKSLESDRGLMREKKEEILFFEDQRFRQMWVWFVILIPVVVCWYGSYVQLIRDKPFGNHPASNWLLFVLWILFGILLPLIFYSVSLITEVRRDGLYIRYFPFHLKFRTMPFQEIRSFDVISYSPLKEYGGHGIRYGRSGKAYIVSGKRGVQLVLKSEARLLLGSQKPEQMADAIRSASKK